LAEEYGKCKSRIEQFNEWKTIRDNNIISFANLYTIENYTEGPFDDASTEKFLAHCFSLLKTLEQNLSTLQEKKIRTLGMKKDMK